MRYAPSESRPVRELSLNNLRYSEATKYRDYDRCRKKEARLKLKRKFERLLLNRSETTTIPPNLTRTLWREHLKETNAVNTKLFRLEIWAASDGGSHFKLYKI